MQINMKHLETFEAACELLGYNASEVLPVVEKMPEQLAKAATAATKLFVLSEAAWKAEDKTIDWKDYNQRKYYGWFDLDADVGEVGSSAGFSFDVCDCDRSRSYVGSRLVFPTREIAEYVGKTHLSIYRDLMVIE